MNLLKELAQDEEVEEISSTSEPKVPEDGWNVGHLVNHGIMLSCEGFSIKLDLDQLNALFDLAEDGESGEVRDHNGDHVYVEVLNDKIVLTRDDDKVYPNGVVLDQATLKDMGIEQHEEAEDEQPDEEDEDAEDDDTIEPSEEEELEEGIKRAFRRKGKKIVKGFRVTSGLRKGRVVANPKTAYKPRAPARTRMKLRIASRRKKIVRILKSKRTRMRPTSKRLVRMNKSVSGKR